MDRRAARSDDGFGGTFVHELTRLTPADYDDFYVLRGAGMAESPYAFTTDLAAWQRAERSPIERLLEASRDNADAPIFGARREGELIGLVGLTREPREAVAHKATLWGFYVSPEHRGQGVGRALLAEAMSAARDLPRLRQLRAVVPTACAAAVGLFGSMGFEQFGLERDARWVDGTFHDQLYLWFRLGDHETS